jgi:hypothetical protein
VAFDTYVTPPGKDVGAVPPIFGGFPLSEPFSLGGSLVSATWGDLVNDAPGTYQIARLTFPLGVIPNVINIADVGPNPTLFSNTSQVTPDATVEIPDIPEPTTLPLVAAAGLLALRRRTWRVHTGGRV